MTTEQKKALLKLSDALNELDAEGAIARTTVKVTFQVGEGEKKEEEVYFVKRRNATDEDGIDFSEYRAKKFRRD